MSCQPEVGHLKMSDTEQIRKPKQSWAGQCNILYFPKLGTFGSQS